MPLACRHTFHSTQNQSCFPTCPRHILPTGLKSKTLHHLHCEQQGWEQKCLCDMAAPAPLPPTPSLSFIWEQARGAQRQQKMWSFQKKCHQLALLPLQCSCKPLLVLLPPYPAPITNMTSAPLPLIPSSFQSSFASSPFSRSISHPSNHKLSVSRTSWCPC